MGRDCLLSEQAGKPGRGEGRGERGPQADPRRCQQVATAAAAVGIALRRSAPGRQPQPQPQPQPQQRRKKQVTFAKQKREVRKAPKAQKGRRAQKEWKQRRAQKAHEAQKGQPARKARKRKRRGSPYIHSHHNFDNPPNYYNETQVELHRQVQERIARISNAFETFSKYHQGVAQRNRQTQRGLGAANRLSTLIELYKEVPKTDDYDEATEDFETEIAGAESSIKSYRRSERQLYEHAVEIETTVEDLNEILENLREIQGLLHEP